MITKLNKRRGRALAIAITMILVVALIGLGLFAAVRHLYRSVVAPPLPEEHQVAVVPIGNTDDPNRRADVVFVHGLGGDSLTTWTANGSPKFYWPEALAAEFPDIGVWALNYDAKFSNWLGQNASIEEHAKVVLAELRLCKIGDKRIVFVSHSLGGILVKQLLDDARNFNEPEWEKIANRTKGVVFIATPNTGSSYANFVMLLDHIDSRIRAGVTADQLQIDSPLLQQLNYWYRNNVEKMQIKTKVFYETEGLGGIGTPLIVSKASADPGINNVTPLACNGTHLTICRPKNDKQLIYRSVSDFINQEAVALPTAWDITFADFVIAFNQVRNDGIMLADFLKQHGGQVVTWEAVIRKVKPHSERPSYSLSTDENAPTTNCVIGSMSPRDFKPPFDVGTRVKIRGVIAPTSNNLGAILHECEILDPPKPLAE